MDGDEAQIWKALADPVRRAILDLLREKARTTGVLASSFDQSRYGVMKHLDVLEQAGLISVERRGRERWNHLNGAVLKAAMDRWLTPFQQAWANSLINLAAAVEKEATMDTGYDRLLMELRQEVIFPASAARVFDALTRHIDLWWTSPYRQTGEDSRLSLPADLGGEMIETSGDGRHQAIWGRVEEVRPPHILALSGRFAVKGAVAGHVRFELDDLPENRGCRLVVGHRAIGAISDTDRTNFAAGWEELLDRRLRLHLTRDEGEEHA